MWLIWRTPFRPHWCSPTGDLMLHSCSDLRMPWRSSMKAVTCDGCECSTLCLSVASTEPAKGSGLLILNASLIMHAELLSSANSCPKPQPIDTAWGDTALRSHLIPAHHTHTHTHSTIHHSEPVIVLAAPKQLSFCSMQCHEHYWFTNRAVIRCKILHSMHIMFTHVLVLDKRVVIHQLFWSKLANSRRMLNHRTSGVHHVSLKSFD